MAKDLDLSETAVRRWIAQAEIDAGQRAGLTSAEREELARLPKENRILREERDLLKRAASFFARETRGPSTRSSRRRSGRLFRLSVAEHWCGRIRPSCEDTCQSGAAQKSLGLIDGDVEAAILQEGDDNCPFIAAVVNLQDDLADTPPVLVVDSLEDGDFVPLGVYLQ